MMSKISELSDAIDFFRCDDARAKFKRGSVIFKLEKNLIIEPRLVGATVTPK